MRTSFGVLQYVIVRSALTVSQFVIVLVAPERMGRGQFNDFKTAYVYYAAILNVSQLWASASHDTCAPTLNHDEVFFAVYCLIMFYHELSHDMASIRPLAKFICIKAIVFLTFW